MKLLFLQPPHKVTHGIEVGYRVSVVVPHTVTISDDEGIGDGDRVVVAHNGCDFLRFLMCQEPGLCGEGLDGLLGQV